MRARCSSMWRWQGRRGVEGVNVPTGGFGIPACASGRRCTRHAARAAAAAAPGLAPVRPSGALDDPSRRLSPPCTLTQASDDMGRPLEAALQAAPGWLSTALAANSEVWFLAAARSTEKLPGYRLSAETDRGRPRLGRNWPPMLCVLSDAPEQSLCFPAPLRRLNHQFKTYRAPGKSPRPPPSRHRASERAYTAPKAARRVCSVTSCFERPCFAGLHVGPLCARGVSSERARDYSRRPGPQLVSTLLCASRPSETAGARPRAAMSPTPRARTAAAAAAAAGLALLLLAASPACVRACSSFLVNCEPDGAVVTVRTLDFSSDLTGQTSEQGWRGGASPRHPCPAKVCSRAHALRRPRARRCRACSVGPHALCPAAPLRRPPRLQRRPASSRCPPRAPDTARPRPPP